MFERIESLIQKGIEARTFPCAAVALGDKNGIIYRSYNGFSSVFEDEKPNSEPFPKQFGDSPKRLTEKTMFDMASMTKMMAVTPIVLKAIEDGEISLYDSLFRFLNNVPHDKDDVEIRHLLTHTSGITSHYRLENVGADPQKAAEDILSRPLVNKIGEVVDYSCMGFIVLAKILETVYGEKLDVLAKKMIYAPLDMNDTMYRPRENGKTDFAATEYVDEMKKYKRGEVHDENAYYIGKVSGNAGLFSTLDDTSKFALMLANKGKTKKTTLINERTFDIAIHNYTEGKGESRGLGFQVKGLTVSPMGDLFSNGSYGHTGFTGTSLYVDNATSFFVVLLTNRVHFTRNNNALIRFRRLFHNAALNEYLRGKESGEL